MYRMGVCPMNPGDVLNNRYTLTARIGKGAMGTVYRATDTQTGQEVAVKVIMQDLALDPDLLERFRREGEALRQLRHPNIVGFIEAFQQGEQQCIVMEYMPGGSLHDLIKHGPLPIERIRQITLDLCDALIRAHRLGIIHRDLKPENVLMAPDGTPRLTDFGVAHLAGNTASLTATGTQVGTPYYMSPEAWEGKPLDAQADVWSLGVMLFEMLASQPPFRGDTLVSVMHKVLTAPVPDIRALRPDTPPDLVPILQRMLARNKAQRYPTIRQVSSDLERGALGPPPVSPTPAPPARAMPGWAIGLIVGLGLVGLLGLGGWAYSLSQRAAAPEATPTARGVNPTDPPEALPTETPITPPPSATTRPTATRTVPPPTLTQAPTPTASALPTQAPTAAPKIAPPSPTPGVTCPPVSGVFSAVWAQVQSKIGCSTDAVAQGMIVEENFQSGKMLWRQQIDGAQALVLFNGGTWRIFQHAPFPDGGPEYSCTDANTPAQSPPTPRRGFGMMWCDIAAIRNGLGNATDVERAFTGVTQAFAQGFMVQTDYGANFVFYANGAWETR
jgi:serine/threonine protein kinase